ncbi:MAG: diaminobutyrate acetyltransferase [Candidatus Hydrogenedentes bacterium]|nr:diaminobutyrate acetyltransferase [Candidatus Hydrogenedentota bacterium]
MTSTATNEICLRKPAATDAADVAKLVAESPPLELNTTYAYLLITTHFADTSVVAEREGEIVGFVAGYRPPTAPEALFVWQVAVKDTARGLGIGSRMLVELLKRPACDGVRYLTTTVTPSNASSTRLFQRFAEKQHAEFITERHFGAELFGGGHEEEVLYRIGPLR